MTFARDPLSARFDQSAQRFLIRAYADYGNWVYTWLPQPTQQQRAEAAAMGIDVYEPDESGHEPNRWVRAFKRSARWNLGRYGYASELRPGQPRLGGGRVRGTLMIWDSSAGLVMRPPAGERKYQIRVRLYPNTTNGITAPRAADDWKSDASSR
jgi:hypothetical protein